MSGLRTFALIVSAHRYCAGKFTRHDMYRGRLQSNKMNNYGEDRHCYSFARIKRSWTFGNPYFSFQKQILLTIIYTLSKNEQKFNVELKIIQDFRPRDIESCHLATASYVKLWLLNSNLFFTEPHQLTKFT